ncbi:MAG: hypothetical protein RR391_14820, partial [Chryseobacterium sp.]
MERFYTFIFKKLFLLLIVSFSYLSAQNMGAADDFDGDGISNFNDIDSDNDGVLDFIECASTASMKRYNNGAAATWNGATTITTDVNTTTFISAQTATGDGFFLNRIITGSANTANNVYNSNYRITGTRNDFWLLNKDGVDNNSGNVTYTFSQPIPISELIVLIEDVDYRTSGSAPTVTISLQGVGTTATTLDLTPYKSGTLDLPNPSNAINGGYNTATGVITYNVPILGTGTNENRAYALVGNSNKLVKSIKIAYNLDEKANLYIGRVQENCDNDGDGVSNIFDLDSDGDGCPDTVESGAAYKAGAVNTSSGTIVNTAANGGTQNNVPKAIVGTPGNYGANGFYNGSQSDDTFAATYTGVYNYDLATNPSLKGCLDTDNDGTPDAVDIDDDNDGVPDSTESPACYYLASEWNTGAKPSDMVKVSSALTTTTGNFSQLFDGVSGTTAVTFTSGQPIQDTNVYLFSFMYPVKLDALYLKFNTATQFAGTTRIQGSNTNNGNDWVDLSAAISQTAGSNTTYNGGITLTNSIKYPVTSSITTGYKYIRVTGVAATNTNTQNAAEAYFDFKIASYVSSLYPKATCADANIDGDGILPQLDLDTDGDSCSDALESGATAITTTNYQFPDVDTNNDGLVDAVDSDGDGIVNYTSTYHTYAESKTLQACKDTDGDGIKDIVDIDDDNDGIPDVDEQSALSCTPTVCSSWVAPPITAGTSAPATIIVNGEEVSYTITSNTTITPQYGSWETLQCGLGTLTGIPYWQRQDGSPTITFNFSKPVTGLQFVLSAIENIPESVQIITNNTSGQQKICESCNKANIETVNATTLNVYGSGSNAEIFNISGPAYTTASIRVVNQGGGFLLTYGLCAITTVQNDGYVDIDTDGDGIPNRLDLDSDGDGCPDLKEARVSPTTDVITPSTTNSVGTSYGIASPTGAQLNPTAADVNNDGLNDSVDTDVNGSPDYVSSYNPIALNKTLNLCSDIDADGIPDLMDIDDDNDGITDAMESPSCFYTSASDFKNTSYITSDLSYTTSPSQPFSLALDGNTATWADIDAGFVTNRNLIMVNMPLANPVPLTTVTVQIGINNSFAASSFQLQGWTGNSWEAMSATQPMATANTTYTFTNTLHPTKSYNKFRIRGLTGYAANGTRLHEVNFTFAQPFVSSLQPKTNCTVDTDTDTIPNHQDLDSDNDGCSDLKESNVSPSTDVSTPSSTTNNNGTSYGIAATSLTNSQLNPNAADANND